MKIQLHQSQFFSEIGKRSNNEDNIFPPKLINRILTRNNIFMVCDGVGGLDKGEIASQLVCDSMSESLHDIEINSDTFNEAITKAEKRIQSYIDLKLESEGMATTLSFIAFNANGVVIAHIGDSRVYHVRNTEILFKTKDHTFVNELVQQNIISQEEASVHPKRNVITKAVMGYSEETHQEADIEFVSNVAEGDYFFLCSDGVLESVSDEELIALLSDTERSNEDKTEWIKNKCLENSKDNYSGYLLQINTIERD